MTVRKECSCEKCQPDLVRPYPVQPALNCPYLAKRLPVSVNEDDLPPVPQLPQPGSLHDAIGNLRSSAIEGIIQKNPQSIKQIGFNGQSVLHRACLRGDSEVVELLLRFSADPNACNNFRETPLHFACKRGSVRIVHLLVENGADISAVDKVGKGALHHAAHSGSVAVIHYLCDVCEISARCLDYNCSTPLHLVCTHGHAEAFSYLMRNGRCDITAVDRDGNNCLHIASEAGHSVMCWRLLESGGLTMLHRPNHQGSLPADMASKGHQCRHRKVFSLLSYYTKRSVGNGPGKVGKPKVGWYAHLLMPSVYYAMMVLSTLTFPEWACGYAVICELALLIFILYSHGHRMKHISRLPNPVYTGLFAAGLFHTIICYFWNIFPYIFMTHWYFWCVSVPLATLLLVMYYKLLTTDPGACTEPVVHPQSGEHASIRDIATGVFQPNTFCDSCEIVKPPTVKHCKLCERCYSGMDHHCLFIYRCVASNNHRLFLSFIAFTLLCMVLFVYISSEMLCIHHPGLLEWQSEAWAFIFHKRPWLWTAILANTASSIWGVLLLKFQLKLVSKGHRTWNQPNLGVTNLTATQRIRNVLHFFIGYKPYAVDSILAI